MARYKVAQVGCGARGAVHLDGWLRNPDLFEVVGVCDLDRPKMEQVMRERGVSLNTYTDADTMLSELQPDIFCFSTPPGIRLEMVELAARYGVKGLVFEKPMATSIAEARRIVDICRENNIKTAVSHQHKYVTSFQKLKQILDSGEIGVPYLLTASCQAWLAQLGTHYVDYVLWAAGSRVKWVAGHVHGKELLSDSHPSPNYTFGQLGFENGVRAIVEFGKLSASHKPGEKFWFDDRLTIYGPKGYVWCDPDGCWGAFTPETGGEAITEQGVEWVIQERETLQPLFAADMARWMDDDSQPHPCNLDITYHGYEVMEALCISALENRRVDLPLDPEQCSDVFERMRQQLPDCSELQ